MAQPGIIGYRIGDHVYDPADVTVLIRTDWPGLGDEAAAAVPVPVLEALASAWENQAAEPHKPPDGSYGLARRTTFADCARMLREVITHGGQG